MKKSLPFDSASQTNPVFLPFLIKSAGEGSKAFLEAIIQNTTRPYQDRTIFIASGASGMGKTHLAYAVGKSIPVILIRIAGSPNALTPPWRRLKRILVEFDSKRIELYKREVRRKR